MCEALGSTPVPEKGESESLTKSADEYMTEPILTYLKP